MARPAASTPFSHAHPTRRAWLEATGCAALGAGWVTPLWANAPAAASAPAWLVAAVPGATLLGQGRLTFLGLRVYDARLWAAPGFDAARFEQQPFALALTYLRGLKGALIAERSLKEMRPLPGFEANRETDWLARMTALFPDVGDGDTLVGLHLPGVGVRFMLNGQLRGQVEDALFARLFFGIWLSPKTSEPALRQALLGAP